MVLIFMMSRQSGVINLKESLTKWSCPLEGFSSYEIMDFTQGVPESTARYCLGRYNEPRPFLYKNAEKFEDRHLHVGLDFGAPAGAKVVCFYEGVVEQKNHHQGTEDYGPTIALKHCVNGKPFYSLYAHLSLESLLRVKVGQTLRTGQVFAELGDKGVNGGWPPHLHFQLSWVRPHQAHLPGVVSLSERETALKEFPDPSFVLP